MTPTAQEPRRAPASPARAEGVASGSHPALYLAAVLLLAAAVRMVGLNEQSLSMDEVAELSISEGSLSAILVAHDGFPPLYHFALHTWSAIFPGDLAARWLSLLIGVLSVGVVWAAARQVGGERTALWCALLVSLSPFHIWHSQEARAYILYYLCAAVALYWFFTALKTNSSRAWGCYAAASWVGLLTHYYFGLLILTNACVLLLEWGRLAPHRRLLIAHGALAVASLPIAWLLLGDLSLEGAVSFPNRVNVAALGYTLFSFVAGYAIGPSARELHDMSVGQAISQVLPWLVVTVGSAGVLLVRGFRVLSPERWNGRLLLMTLLPVVGAAAAAAAMGVTFQVRHVVWASIPLMLLLGTGASELSRRPAIIAPALLGLMLVFGVSRYQRHSLPRYQNEDARALAAFLKAQDAASPVFVTTGYMARPIRRYLGEAPATWALPGVLPDGTNLAQVLRSLEQEAPTDQPFWLAYTREFHGDPQGRLLEALEQRYSMTLQARFPGIRLYRLSPADTAATRR